MNKNVQAPNAFLAEARAAFTRIQSACPEDAALVGKYIGAINHKNVIALDEGEAFILTDAEGRNIRATKRTVRLSAENGGLVQPVYNNGYGPDPTPKNYAIEKLRNLA